MILNTISTRVTDGHGIEHNVAYKNLTRREIQKLNEYEGKETTPYSPFVVCFADDCDEPPAIEITETDVEGCTGYLYCSLDCLEYDMRRGLQISE